MSSDGMSLDNYCKAYQNKDFISDDESTPYIQFLIDIHAHFTFIPPHALEDEDDLPMEDLESRIIFKSFKVPRDYFIDDETSRATIFDMLCEMFVPYDHQPDMIEEILNCARSMASAPHNTNCKTLPMVVNLGVICILEPEESMDGLVPATKSSIETLEKVKVNEGFTNQCVICLEKLLIGSEATRMPCSHLYHGDCIIDWLEKSGFCPLCRFQMPS